MSEKKEKKDYSFSKLLLKVLPLVKVGAPGLALASSIVAVFHGVSWGMGVWTTQMFFDSVAGAAAGLNDMRYAILMLLLMGGVTIGQQALNGVHNFMTGMYFNQMSGHLRHRLAGKAARIEPAEFESPDFLDDVNKARGGAEAAMMTLFTVTTVLTFYTPYFIYMLVYLYMQKPLLAMAIPLVFVPVALTQFIRSKVFTKLEDEAAPIRRQYEYYEKCISDREFFKETRTLGAFSFFRNLYRDAMRLLNKKTWQANKHTAKWELIMKLITLAGYFAILWLLFDALMAGEITVGAFAAVFSSIAMLFGVMEEIITGHIGYMVKNIGSTKGYIRFMEAPERGGVDARPDAGQGISLKNVSFRYPGSNKDALSGVTLTVGAGETVAIVGENGAGKTTLVRLMTGLFLPDSGEVSIGGMNPREVNMKSLYGGISAVFQKFQKYRMTLDENVSISDMESEAGAEGVRTALGKADMSTEDPMFPDGGDTMLSREFDGVDLSGGQWQRVAIARGFYRAHNMIVLDEPTAAIDPLEETKVYRKFAELSKDATAIVVTHRMGSARIADYIVVMDDGRIDDIGTHDELMAKGGKYADMVNAQAEWYA